MQFVSLLTITIILSIIIAVYAKKLNRSAAGYFMLSLLLTPLVTFIILLIVGKKEKIENAPKRISSNGRLIETADGGNYTVSIDGDDDWNSMKETLTRLYGSEGAVTEDETFVFEISNQEGSVRMNRLQAKAHLVFKNFSPDIFLSEFPPDDEGSGRHDEPDPVDTLERMSKLYENGYISKEEFEEKKRKLLQKI